MDSYSQKTLQALLVEDKAYLQELLQELGIQITNQTAEEIGKLLDTQRSDSSGVHESSIYTCKCGSNNVIIRDIQTRSADEGSTVLHICLKCGVKW